ncbi:MAG: T9SS type A sorting domain-containing protein [Bacteroidia bacterium]
MKNISSSFIKTTLFSLFFFGLTNISFATHYAGTDLFYESLGSNQYRVTLVFYRDCGGVQEPVSASVALTNQCTGGSTASIIIKKPNSISFTNGEEITSNCTGVVSACNGGTAPGLRKWVYEGVITVPQGGCTDWKISYQLCCRNFAITTLQNPGGESLYTETTFKSNINDNAPKFTNNPIAFACANQPFNFNQGAYDADGDSIAYELDNPLSANGAPVVFAAGYTKDIPFLSSNGFTLDAVTGGISFTPNSVQVGVFAIKVKQYRNGNLIGYVRRDMEIFVTNCNANTLPVASGFDGTANYSMNVCADEQLCTSVLTNDADTAQNVTVNWNQGIANATYAASTGNHPTANICWTPTAADASTNPHVFTLTVKDNACPTNGMQTFSYVINVIVKPVISISKTDASCNGNNGTATVQTNQGNASSYLWSNGNTNAAINGLAAGNYTVTVTNLAGCSVTASVTIAVGSSNISLSGATIADNGNCNGDVSLFVISGVAPYSFNWSNGKTVQNISNVCAGTYTVSVTDANGCTGSASYPVALKSSGCKIKMSLKSNSAGQCLQGGIINAVVNGAIGKCTAILTNSSGIMVAQKNFKNTFAFDALYHDTYTVSVTDANGCTAAGTVTVNAGGCGAPVNVQVINVTPNSAKVKWDNCGAITNIVRYKVDGVGNPFTYISVNNLNEVVLPNLQNNTVYSVRIKSLCMQGMQSQYTIAKKFCTGGCIAPKTLDETDLSDNENDNYINAFDVMPNPAKDVIHLTGESSSDRTAQIAVTSLLGKVMMTQSVDINRDFNVAVDINALPQGVYMITISGFENSSKRFIKM